ncbi:MAG: radical SAM protein, partial [Acidobacteriota bacterium]
VGIVYTVAETFGQHRKWLDEFITRIEPYNLVWMAGGVRACNVDPDVIMRMKRCGCYSIIYGNETGSAKIMQVIEKKVSIEDNYNAAKWTIEAGLDNTMQLVIGMPGESPETIAETIEYCKFASSLAPEQDPRAISINFAQALPGTPLYEFARSSGLIGADLDADG